MRIFVIALLAAAGSLIATVGDQPASAATWRDSRNGVIWMRCTAGHAWQRGCTGEAMQMEWMTAENYCSQQRLAGHKWRLPRYHELLSIVDIARRNPAIDTQNFPNTLPGRYWTADTDRDDNTSAWYVDFEYGFTGIRDKYSLSFVRCVAAE